MLVCFQSIYVKEALPLTAGDNEAFNDPVLTIHTPQ